MVLNGRLRRAEWGNPFPLVAVLALMALFVVSAHTVDLDRAWSYN